MAVVDLATGNITGCLEGSRVWWHEKGHIEFSKQELGSKISYYQYHFMMVAVLFGSLSLLINSIWLRVFTFLNALGMICSYIYEEVWCWAWAMKEWKKVNS